MSADREPTQDELDAINKTIHPRFGGTAEVPIKEQIEENIKAYHRSQIDDFPCKSLEVATSEILKLVEKAEQDFAKDLIRTFPYEVGTGKKLAENNHSFNVASNLWKKHIKSKLREEK